MKKFFLLGVALAFVLVPLSASAINLGFDKAKGAAVEAGYAESTGQTTLSENIGVGINLALSFVGVIFLVLMVYAGYLWMTARGEEAKVEKAQSIIRSTVIGLIIATAAYSITYFVLPQILSKTTGPGGGSGTVGGPTAVCCRVCDDGGNCAKHLVSDSNACADLCPIDESTCTEVYDRPEDCR